MATYAFKALDYSGSPSKGEMEAGDKQAVAAQLRSKGLIVVDIEEQTPASAGDLLASWLAHDLLHVRQLARLHWQYLTAAAKPFQTDYAGPWKES